MTTVPTTVPTTTRTRAAIVAVALAAGVVAGALSLATFAVDFGDSPTTTSRGDAARQGSADTLERSMAVTAPLDGRVGSADSLERLPVREGKSASTSVNRFGSADASERWTQR